MSTDHRRGGLLPAWLAGLALLSWLVVSHLDVSYDLGLFLPAPSTSGQQVLIERLGQSPGSRFLMLAVPDEPPRVARLAESLRGADSVERVLTGDEALEGPVPEPAWSRRFLLTDMDWSADGLRAALEDRLTEMGLGVNREYEDLVRRDPALVSLGLLESLLPAVDADWRLPDGRRVLLVITRAPAFRIDAQEAAIEQVRAAVTGEFPDAGASSLSGAGVFGVEIRDTIHAEATWRSLLATLALVLVLAAAYRNVGAVLTPLLPLATALLAATAAVALAFRSVHGITLAFGVSLLGLCLDYPLHYLSHARNTPGRKAMRLIWPTLRLGAFSTILAYGALLFGGARGMAQLGLFSAVGVAAAALTTRWLLPRLPGPRRRPASPEKPENTTPDLRFGHLLLAAGLGLAAVFTLDRGEWWDSSLSSLSPIPAERLRQEGDFRQAVGAPSIRYQVALRDDDLQRLLERSESLHQTLRGLSREGLFDDFRDLTTLLPSHARQQQRQAGIPPPDELRRRLALAISDMPFDAGTFAGFVSDAAEARKMAPVGPETYAATDLEDALGQFLYRDAEGGWTALVPLYGGVRAEALERRLEQGGPGAFLVDYRRASETLVTDYRQRTLRVLGVVLLLIALLLTWGARFRRAAWALAVVLTAVLLASLVLRSVFGPLNLYHLVGLLLVAGIGLDYALFLSMSGEGRRDTRHAVAACVASTTLAFGVLAASRIPALQSLGAAVSLGAALCFIGARFGSTDAVRSVDP